MNRRPHALAAPVATHRRPLWRALAQAGLTLSLAGAALPGLAQSLGTLYQSARDFDATYLSARSQYQANLAKAEQARAGLRPQAALSAGASVANIDSSLSGSRDTNSQNAALSASLPLYRPANQIAFDQAQKSLEVAEGLLLAAEHDLIVRSSQAYFDVLAAQDTLTFVKAQKTAVAEQLAAAVVEQRHAAQAEGLGGAVHLPLVQRILVLRRVEEVFLARIEDGLAVAEHGQRAFAADAQHVDLVQDIAVGRHADDLPLGVGHGDRCR